MGTSVYYPKPLPDTRFYRETYGYAAGSHPEAATISYGSIAFPVGPHLEEGDVETIVEAVKRVLVGGDRHVVDVAGKRIALVGGAGFIGHSLAVELKERGAEVEVIDGLAVNNLLHYTGLPPGTPNRELYIKIIQQRLDKLHAAGVPIHVQDARDYHGLSRALAAVEPQVVVHLAAIAHAGKSNKDPMSTFGHSLRTLENALDYARGNAEHFVYFSSSMVYGNFLDAGGRRGSPARPDRHLRRAEARRARRS